MTTQTYTIERYVEITPIKRGDYEIRCQNRIWKASTKKKALAIKRAIQNWPSHYALLTEVAK